MTDNKDAEELTQGYFQKFGGFTCSWENVQQIISEMLETENALKETLARAGYRIAELKNEIDNLKEQNKAILEDNDTLNKWIDELKAQIEKTKNCVNCKHKNIYQYDFINECRLTGNHTNYEYKCDKWELEE